MHKKSIAIIGGGVSGLAVAYELGKVCKENNISIEIVVYEAKQVLGGHAETIVTPLGTSMPEKEEFVRWADMGVNDVNLDVYTNIRRVMKEIGYYPKRGPAESQAMRPLENTACYFTLDGNIAYTDDEDLHHGVSDPNFDLRKVEDGQLNNIRLIIHRAALNITDPEHKTYHPKISVGEFFELCIKDPKTQLEAAAKELGMPVDWSDPDLQSRIERARDNIFYPRMSAMYFADEYGPQGMPLSSPYNYYRLQEGGNDRRYFHAGTQTWIDRLAEYLDQYFSDTGVSINIIKQAKTKVVVSENNVRVWTNEESSEGRNFDYGVICTHADDALALLDFQDTYKLNAQAATVRSILENVSYTNSIAVCHTYSGVMPPNRNLWRTYNVLIRKGAAMQPYSMTFLINRHQNDAEDPGYNQAGLPQYFVTLNPVVPIPDQYVLRIIDDLQKIPISLQNVLPSATLSAIGGKRLEAGYGDMIKTYKDSRAIAYFKHPVLNQACLDTQDALKTQYHAKAKQKNYRLFFSGGWTKGAGLHEECWQQALDIRDWLLPIFENNHTKITHATTETAS